MSSNSARCNSWWIGRNQITLNVSGAEFPSRWLNTVDGRIIVTDKGEPIITTTTRERIDLMWDADINISGESTLDIVPAMRKVTVNVRNKNLGDWTA